MKFSKLGLLTLLISLFILGSCKNQDGIGLGVDAANQLNGTILTDSTVLVNTVADDTVATSGGGVINLPIPLSYFKDPDLGVTEANIAFGIQLPNNSIFTPPTGTVTIDSAILVLPYALTGGFYGDSLASKFKLDVHQLNEQILSTKTYYNNKAWNYSSDIVGTKTFAARSHDTLKVFNIIAGKPDTLYKVRPQIRVPISTTFISSNLFNAPASQLASTPAFQAAFKGLYVTLDQTQTSGPGGNLMLVIDSGKVNIHYRVNKGTTTDTLLLTMPVQGGLHAAQIKHTYTAKVQAALNNTATDGSFYLQGLSGLKAKVSFPNLKSDFASLGSNVAINRAELVVSPRPGTTTPYGPLPRLTMYQLDIAKQRIAIQDASVSDIRSQLPVNFGGFLNNKNQEYHFILTSYLQDLLRGKTVDYGTYIIPGDNISSTTAVTALSFSSVLPSARHAERTIAVGKNSPYRIKLNIIYTKINK